MERVVVDESVVRQFAGKGGSVELVDAGGKVLGRFVPTGEPDRKGEGIGDEPTSEELEEIARNCKRWYTADEVMARLRSIG